MKRRVAKAGVRGMFRCACRRGVEVIRARPFERFLWLAHGFTTRRGAFNLGFSPRFMADEVRANRARLLEALDAQTMRLVALRQIHSAVAHTLAGPPTRALVGDALLTRAAGLLLAVQVADCLPILLVDVRHRAVAAVHAGWRGTLRRIAEKTLGEMRVEFGTRPADVLAAIGPGIHACCYEVGEEVIAEYESQFPYAETLLRAEHRAATRAALWSEPLDPIARKLPPPPGHAPRPRRTAFLDLVAANRQQLLAAGVLARNIFAHPDCTACNTSRYFSYREEGPTGRMMGLIGIRQS